ncbi:hypothetical protein [Massilia sp. LC238]|uniref:hypothetical protein n=1 Tax=Massilia sp. LC238 TaxID=1502852 RepID=UPI0004E44600|nr:hypothetical protein [Massilia sp. LC238]KFC61957.1 hypothetical protein FG94_04997 [Massilia sp. LC238]
MQRLPKQIAVAELGAASAALYTAPANTKTTISACSVTNKTGNARTVTLTVQAAGGTARNIAFGMGVGAGETRVVHGAIGQTLEAGGVLAGLADAAGALDIVVSAYETNP